VTGQRILIGCGGVLALGVVVLLAVLVGSVIGGGGSSPSPTVTDSEDKAKKKTESKKKEDPKNIVVAAGEPAELRDRSLVVNEVANFIPPNQFSRPDPGNEFVRVFVTLTNTSNQAFDYNPNNFKAQDSNGVEKTPQTISQLPYAVHHASLAPGGTLEGNLVFQVPQGDSGLSLVYEPFERNVGTVNVTL